MAVISAGSFQQALWEGVNSWWGQAYNEYKSEWPEIFSEEKSSKYAEDEVGIMSFGLAKVSSDGSPVEYDIERQSFSKRYTHVTYKLGFIVTKEMFEDDLYQIVAPRRAKGLAFSFRSTEDTVGANVLNRAFNSSYTGGDGKELCATDHPLTAGGTWKNEPTTAVDLSEDALEQACIDIAAWTDERGKKIAVKPKKLIIPSSLQFDAERILKSTQQSGTANNDVNAIRSLGMFPGGAVVNHFLTDTDAWFVITDCMDGMKRFTRVNTEFTQDNDFDTDNAKFKARARYVYGWTDPRGIYGSPGA